MYTLNEYIEHNYVDFYGRYANCKLTGNVEIKIKCPYPNHADKHPSCDLNTKTGVWYCQVCKKGGDFIKFMSLMEGESEKICYKKMMDEIEEKKQRRQKKETSIKDTDIKETYTYKKDGKPYYRSVKYFLEGEAKKKMFTQCFNPVTEKWSKGGIPKEKRFLYNYDEVVSADNIIIVEGEKDVETIRTAFEHTKPKINIVPTTSCNGLAWLPQYTETIKNKRVFIIGDTGKAGERNVFKIASEIPSVLVVKLKIEGDNKDITDYLIEGGFTKKEWTKEIKKLLETAEVKKIIKYNKINDESLSKILKPYFIDTYICCEGITWLKYIEGIWVDWNPSGDIANWIENIFDNCLIDKEEKRQVLKNRYLNKAGRNNLLSILKKKMWKKTSEINDLNCMAFKNGIFDLEKKEFEPHSPCHYITGKNDIIYDKDAKAPEFEIYLQNIAGDDDTYSYLLKMCGYLMTNSTVEQCMFYCFGARNSGKSTFIKIIMQIAGKTVSKEISSSAIGVGDKRVMYDLFGMKMVFIDEFKMPKDPDILKSLITADEVRAAAMGENSFQYKPMFKVVASANPLPSNNDKTKSVERRIKLLKFTRSLTNVDVFFKKRIIENEGAGIANLFIKGFMSYKPGDLIKVPDRMGEFSREFEDGNKDLFDTFLEEKYECVSTSKILSNDFKKDYYKFCEENDEQKPKNIVEFNTLIRNYTTDFQMKRLVVKGRKQGYIMGLHVKKSNQEKIDEQNEEFFNSEVE